VYDPWVPKHQVREDSPPPVRYLNAYAASKLQAEQAVQASQRDAIILRPHAIYGPGEQTLRPRLLRARRFGTLFAIGTGQNHLSLTHVENLVDAIELALRAPTSSSYHVYNVADAITPTVDQALRQLLTELGLPQRIIYLPTHVAWPLATLLERLYTAAHSPMPPLLTRYAVSQLSHEYTLDIGKSVRELGYQPGRSYLDGLTGVRLAPATPWEGAGSQRVLQRR
jgi:nucleoside-diphosphate-sugar epimerase